MAILHPAARILIDQVLGEIGEENGRLRDDVERLYLLCEYIQKIELLATVDLDPYESEAFGFPIEEVKEVDEVICVTRLCEGTVVQAEGEGTSRLVFPVSAAHRLLLKCIGLDQQDHEGGIGLMLAGQSLGRFSFNLPDAADSIIFDFNEEAGKAHLTVYISDHVSVQGEIGNLTDEDIVHLKKATFISDFMMSTGHLAHLADLTFEPASVAINLTPQFSDTLNLVKTAMSPETSTCESWSPSDELRHSIIAALGEEGDLQMLYENWRLKALKKIGERALGVELSHPGGTVSCSLEEGMLAEDDAGNETWDVSVLDQDNLSMAAANVEDSTLSLSGFELNVYALRTRLMHSMMRVEMHSDPFLEIQIPYDIRGANAAKVVAVFDWDDVAVEDRVRTARNYWQDDVVSGTFHLKLTKLCFSMELVGPLLTMAGLGDFVPGDDDEE